MTSIITALRDIVPIRPLTLAESLRIAELQTTTLLRLSGVQRPPVPETVITDLPRLQVVRIKLGDLSGAAQWAHGRWLILINGADVSGRQRFSIGHEFKHILDNPFIDVLYPDDYGLPHRRREEQVCDYFAGCLLMPRAWLKHAWATTRDCRELAARFAVSQLAMRVRLLQTGLIDGSARCRTAA